MELEHQPLPPLKDTFPICHWHQLLKEKVAPKPGLVIAEIGSEAPSPERQQRQKEVFGQIFIDPIYLKDALQAEVYAINLYSAAIEPLKEMGFDDAHLILNDQDNLKSIPDNLVDVAFSSNVLAHSNNVSDAIKELVRITKPDGRVVICADYFEANDKIEQDLTIEHLPAIVTESGLEITNQEIVQIPEKKWREYYRQNNPYVIIEARPTKSVENQ